MATLITALLVGCVPGQPDRAGQTADAYMRAYVGATQDDPAGFACPGVLLPTLEPAAPDAVVSVSQAGTDATGTFTVVGSYAVDGAPNHVTLILRTDGKCILDMAEGLPEESTP